MRLVTTLSAGKTKIYLETACQFLQMGKAESRPCDAECAVVQVTYRIEDLDALLPLVKEMVETKVLPEVYVWDEDANEPEVLVLFRVVKASTELMQHVVRNGVLASMLPQISPCELLTTAEANIPGDCVEDFFELCGSNLKTLVIFATELNDGPRQLLTFQDAPVLRYKPDMSLFG